MTRKEISSGRPWEKRYGYSRAVRVGGLFQSSLTSPADEAGRIVHSGDVQGQTRQCLKIIGQALAEAGLGYSDIVATRIYMLDTRRWETWCGGRIGGNSGLCLVTDSGGVASMDRSVSPTQLPGAATAGRR